VKLENYIKPFSTAASYAHLMVVVGKYWYMCIMYTYNCFTKMHQSFLVNKCHKIVGTALSSFECVLLQLSFSVVSSCGNFC